MAPTTPTKATTTTPPPCKLKIHTFTCGHAYTNPPCKCHPSSPRFPIPNSPTHITSTKFGTPCRECKLEVLQQAVDSAAEALEQTEESWQRTVKEALPQAATVRENWIKAVERRERVASNVNKTMSWYEGHGWVLGRATEGNAGWVEDTGA